MKKLIVAVAALLISVSSFAQFGIIAGYTSSASTIKGAIDDTKNFSAGTISQFHAGVTYKFEAGKIFAIQPSFIYISKGCKATDFSTAIQSLTRPGEYKTGFLEIPVQVQVGFGGSIFRIYGFAEPFVGLAITNYFKSGIDYSSSRSSALFEGKWEKADWDDITNRVEYGIGLGLGVELFEHVQVSARYYWNIGNVYNFSWTDVKDAPKGKCNGISVSAAILF